MERRKPDNNIEHARPRGHPPDPGSVQSRLLGAYRGLPEKARIVLTGTLGLLFSLITYEIIYALNPIPPQATISWCLAFLIGVARQHALHRWLTFSHFSRYWPSLRRAYTLDSGSLLLSVGLNWLLTEAWAINHRVAWLVCLATVASINLFLLKRYVFHDESKPPFNVW